MEEQVIMHLLEEIGTVFEGLVLDVLKFLVDQVHAIDSLLPSLLGALLLLLGTGLGR